MMKKNLYAFIIALLIVGCSSSKGSSTGDSSANSVDETYGYSEKNAIKVGGFEQGPKNERDYLNSLTGPNGEPVSFTRKGSCCQFKTANSPYGMGMLDMYRVSYQGKKDTVLLYINMYDKGKLKAPKGFIMK
ncbi:2-dehydro-3-deoxyphosphooctonate aldolase [Flavobacterium sp.]|uniref:2-dehydro-3-deoxyphosphooctonate aldolase n=1 Tax=Flavobacterium sp. TaxID=239 RepID=UPI002B4AE049|nr:2-dehydro-3-deoxyphosphooctonate aldolase [Flavobacterium sp.]HLP64655.1 hypothetical protein [Flavobacterium sp.]